MLRSVKKGVPAAHINRIAASVPENDVHDRFVQYACQRLEGDERSAKLFGRLVKMGGIEHRYSVLPPEGPDSADAIFLPGAFPTTAARMRLFEKYAPELAHRAVEELGLSAEELKQVTHLVVTSCTGMSAPGVDLQIAERCGLAPGVERTMVGFMGCYAAINALKLAHHIVRSEPEARVLMLNLELCTLHLKESTDLEQMLSFFLFADGCAASLITADPTGLRLDSFRALLAPQTADLITWNVGDQGFDMMLSGQVPGAIREALGPNAGEILRGTPKDEIELWAVHPGGRSVLDAVAASLELPANALNDSREVLRRNGNMSSPSVVFVLKSILDRAQPGQKGCGMAFGPGLVAETMRFEAV